MYKQAHRRLPDYIIHTISILFPAEWFVQHSTYLSPIEWCRASLLSTASVFLIDLLRWLVMYTAPLVKTERNYIRVYHTRIHVYKYLHTCRYTERDILQETVYGTVICCCAARSFSCLFGGADFYWFRLILLDNQRFCWFRGLVLGLEYAICTIFSCLLHVGTFRTL